MDEKKKEYLKNQIGFHLDDLTPRRRAELATYSYLSSEWKYAALAKKPLSDWNNYGYGLFKNADFIQEVNAYLKAIDEMDVDDMFAVKRSDLSESGKVINMTYRPKQPQSRIPHTRQEAVSAKIDKFFLLLEGC